MIFALPVSLFILRMPALSRFSHFPILRILPALRLQPPHAAVASPFCFFVFLHLALLLSRPFVVSFFCRLTLLSVSLPFCRFVFLSSHFFYRHSFLLLFFCIFSPSHTKRQTEKTAAFFRLPFLPALQSGRRSVFAAIVCPMILRTDQFVPAPFTRKFVIRLPFPTKRRSLSYVLSLLGL